jgi:Skp family chaperone for outer membrane proteins
MNLVKKLFFVLIFISVSVNFLKAEDKISYIDIDYIITNTVAGKEILNLLKKEEESKINKFKLSENDFKNEETKILAKRNMISKEEINKELKLLQDKFKKYNQVKLKEIDVLKNKRNRNIINFINQINPIIEKYMNDNSIYMLIEKKNVFIASKDYDITKILIELIDNQIKTLEIK